MGGADQLDRAVDDDADGRHEQVPRLAGEREQRRVRCVDDVVDGAAERVGGRRFVPESIDHEPGVELHADDRRDGGERDRAGGTQARLLAGGRHDGHADRDDGERQHPTVRAEREGRAGAGQHAAADRRRLSEAQQGDHRGQEEHRDERFRPHEHGREQRRGRERNDGRNRGGRSWSEHGQPTDQHHDQPRRGAAEQGVERQRSMEHGHRIFGEPLHGRQQRCVARLPRAVVVHHPWHATTEEPGHRELGRFVRPERELVAAAGDPQSNEHDGRRRHCATHDPAAIQGRGGRFPEAARRHDVSVTSAAMTVSTIAMATTGRRSLDGVTVRRCR